jgi:hypothetical protein
VYAYDPTFERSFRREAQLAARFKHPNIIAIHAVGKVGELVYFSMDFHERGVADMLTPGQPMDLPLVLRIGIDVASALEFAHKGGLIHRDLKPANLRQDVHGNTIVTDFGIAEVASQYREATGSSVVVGTPKYMSPEQARGKRVDHRSDLYSFGVTLYQMCTGSVPYEGTDWYELARKHIEEPVPLPSERCSGVHPDIQRLILRCLEKDPGSRYQEAREISADLGRIARGQALSMGRDAGAATVVRPMPQAMLGAGGATRVRRMLARPRATLGIAAAVAALMGGLGWLGHSRSVEARQFYAVDSSPTAIYSESSAPDTSGVMAVLEIEFNQAPDPTTVSPGNVHIESTQVAMPPCDVSVLEPSTISVKPRAPLPYATDFDLVVTPGVRNRHGHPLMSGEGASTQGLRVRLRTGAKPVSRRPAAPHGDAAAPARPTRGILDVVALPAAAEIMVVVNGVQIGLAPQAGVSIPADRPAQVVLYGTRSGSGFRVKLLQEPVTVQAGGRVELRRTVPPFGSVNIASAPPGRVIIDGVDTGEMTPLAGYMLLSGRHTLQITPVGPQADQYRAVLHEFDLPSWEWGYRLGPFGLPAASMDHP